MWGFMILALLVAGAIWGWFRWIEDRAQAREAEVWERIYQHGKDVIR